MRDYQSAVWPCTRNSPSCTDDGDRHCGGVAAESGLQFPSCREAGRRAPGQHSRTLSPDASPVFRERCDDAARTTSSGGRASLSIFVSVGTVGMETFASVSTARVPSCQPLPHRKRYLCTGTYDESQPLQHSREAVGEGLQQESSSRCTRRRGRRRPLHRGVYNQTRHVTRGRRPRCWAGHLNDTLHGGRETGADLPAVQSTASSCVLSTRGALSPSRLGLVDSRSEEMPTSLVSIPARVFHRDPSDYIQIDAALSRNGSWPRHVIYVARSHYPDPNLHGSQPIGLIRWSSYG
ncbi:hypothetical protein JHW43_006626 [Diplocarpon mali]|nr:hypothetical protein JHW43_006626 [Diplocarpon mali]